MTLKEKAKELVDMFVIKNTCVGSSSGGKLQELCGSMSWEDAKQCALICVDEMQEHAQMIETPYEGYSNPYQFLKAVKKEIEKL